MALQSFDGVAEKVLQDLEMAMRKDKNINEFSIIPASEEDNKNSSPVMKGENSLGLESWIVPHLYPYAHNQIMQKSNYKGQNLEKVISCLFGVALLNPEMSTVWSRRRQLIISKKIPNDNELRLTRMALCRKPKSNEILAHRRWIITELLKNATDKADLLEEELAVCEMIADRYHSNYHAWSHRMWSMQHLLPDPPFFRRKPGSFPHIEFFDSDLSKLFFCNISKGKYYFIINSEIFQIYCEEIDNNFEWISSHISDHSGLHFRNFIISQMFNTLNSCFYSTDCADFENEVMVSSGYELQTDPAFFSSRKAILSEHLKDYLEDDNGFIEVLDDYLLNLEDNSSLFDLIFCVLMSELKTNRTLCLMYAGHEALWYYRRGLIHLFKSYVLNNVYSSHKPDVSPQDNNGEAHETDFKFEFSSPEDDCILSPSLPDLLYVFYTLVVKHEEETILAMHQHYDEKELKLVKDYERWLKFTLKMD